MRTWGAPPAAPTTLYELRFVEYLRLADGGLTATQTATTTAGNGNGSAGCNASSSSANCRLTHTVQ
jgi:hypothetical protein